MEVWIADKNRIDTFFFPSTAYLDIEVGSRTMNDFLLEIPSSIYCSELISGNELVNSGFYVYIPDTEYGGEILSMTEEGDKLSYSGITFREILNRKYVEPPAGSDYLIVSGDLAACVKKIIGNVLDDYFVLDSNAVGISVTNWKVDRYASALEAVTKLLDQYDYKLTIKIKSESEQFMVSLKPEPIHDYSDEIEVSQDGSLSFTISKCLPTFTHMLLLGKGELSLRTIAYLEWNSGKPREISSIPYGAGAYVYKYDNSSAEDKSKLISDGIKRFKEINVTNSQSVNTSKQEDVYDIGDIVGGRSYVTGILVKEPITKKVIKIERGTASLSYQAGE